MDPGGAWWIEGVATPLFKFLPDVVYNLYELPSLYVAMRYNREHLKSMDVEPGCERRASMPFIIITCA